VTALGEPFLGGYTTTYDSRTGEWVARSNSSDTVCGAPVLRTRSHHVELGIWSNARRRNTVIFAVLDPRLPITR
jgi:hypothetical protein